MKVKCNWIELKWGTPSSDKKKTHSKLGYLLKSTYCTAQLTIKTDTHTIISSGTQVLINTFCSLILIIQFASSAWFEFNQWVCAHPSLLKAAFSWLAPPPVGLNCCLTCTVGHCAPLFHQNMIIIKWVYCVCITL